jgi:hypothetical protein
MFSSEELIILKTLLDLLKKWKIILKLTITFLEFEVLMFVISF